MEGQGGEPQSHTFGARESNWPLAYVIAEDATSCFELLDLHANILLLLQWRKSDFFFNHFRNPPNTLQSPENHSREDDVMSRAWKCSPEVPDQFY